MHDGPIGNGETITTTISSPSTSLYQHYSSSFNSLTPVSPFPTTINKITTTVTTIVTSSRQLMVSAGRQKLYLYNI